jgi:hypothetical protein
MALKPYTFEAPAIYASALINGDLSGLDYYGDDCVAEFEAWLAQHPQEARDVVGCEGEPFFQRWAWTGLQTEMLTYQALEDTDRITHTTSEGA